ncbi:Arylsulfatase [Hondaea fermentalgiana]|uniref:Arylsulfatase n=1 Tax=Hondaea fermentalgiana TaxID=2315210 RepID=A0A2R5H133_9STRA|nr:Arylsulfatase [Hondaea fermentalgiana]|eukprot:GBG34491.1 Arylsulfatase [Hondaea fermentalgiana]
MTDSVRKNDGGGRAHGGHSRAAILTAALLLCHHACDVAGAVACSETVKPNVLIFYTDDQGFGDREKYNGDILSMPNLETLAENGLEFTNGHSAATVCTPSRFAILTGVYAFRQNPSGGAVESDATPMVPGHATLASLLKTVGYRTYMSGKWHLGMDIPEDKENGEINGGPVDVGFDEFFGIPASMNYGNLAYIRDSTFTEPPDVYTAKDLYAQSSCPTKKRGKFCKTFSLEFPYSDSSKGHPISVGASFRADYCLSNFTYEAIRMIQDHMTSYSDQPFFMYLSVTAPHLPHAPHPDFAGKNEYGAYADFLEEIDFRLGQVLQALQDLGIQDETLVIYTSDNGPEEKKDFVKTGLLSTSIYKGEKRDLWEGGHRVPFIMQWPDGIEAGTTWTEAVSQVDLFATLAEMTGATLASDEDGRDSFSIWQPMCDIASASNVREGQPLVIEDDKAKLAVVCDDIKFNSKKKSRLYDLQEHPEENKSAKIWGKRRKFGKAMKNIWKEVQRNGHSESTLCPDTDAYRNL